MQHSPFGDSWVDSNSKQNSGGQAERQTESKLDQGCPNFFLVVEVIEKELDAPSSIQEIMAKRCTALFFFLNSTNKSISMKCLDEAKYERYVAN